MHSHVWAPGCDVDNQWPWEFTGLSGWREGLQPALAQRAWEEGQKICMFNEFTGSVALGGGTLGSTGIHESSGP